LDQSSEKGAIVHEVLKYYPNGWWQL